MGQFNLQAASANTAPMPVSNGQKAEWNSFLDYLKQRGMQGNAALDNRNTNLGQKLMEEYRSQNPHFTLTYDQVPQIQADLQSYRQGLLQKWRAGKASPMEGMANENQLMPNLSAVDGWLGSKTSSYKFPNASLTNSDGSVQNFGVNTGAYDAAIAKIKGK